MKLLIPSLLGLFFLLPISAKGNPGQQVNNCIQFQEEPYSSETVIKKFPKFNIQIKVPKDAHAIQLANGDIFITDTGTYKYLKCIQNNPHALGKSTFGILISKGRKTYDINKELPNRNLRYISATQNLQEIVLRLVFYDNTMTDITLSGGGPLTTKQEVEEEIKSLLEVEKAITAISNHI